jgi:GTP-binding protein Era
MPKAGIVTVAGLPNAGKSTLLNRLVGETLAITSPKPQSTRHRVVGIRTEGDAQMVILDTPGLLDAKDALHDAMRQAAVAALGDADVIVQVADATRPVPPPLHVLARLPAPPRVPVLVALNKLDLLSEEARGDLLRASVRTTGAEATGDGDGEGSPARTVVPVSAVTGEGIDTLVTAITNFLPESPYLYPADEISTQPMRFFCAEFVREAAMEQLGDEVPHALACVIDEYREGSSPLYIRAVLYVERDSQKRIVIGQGGQRIKSLGRIAREKIERFVGQPVYLDLWVKVLPNWRRNPGAVRRLGYGGPT